jgi:PQQ-like domain
MRNVATTVFLLANTGRIGFDGNAVDIFAFPSKSMKTHVALSALLLTTSLLHADWPRWRGAQFDDHSTSTNVLKQWPTEGPAKAWTNEDVGLGYSGVSIVGGTVYTMGLRDVIESVIAVDAATGKEKWTAEVGPIFANGWGDGPRSTPTVDGDHVYAIGGKGNLACIKTSDGAVVWTVSMTGIGGEVPKWGYCESPLVEGNLVICTPGGGNGTMAAFDKLTGKPVWQSTDWTDNAHYSSVIPAQHNGTRQLIQLTMETIAGVNAADGKVLWRHPFPGNTAVIPTPIFHDGHVFVAAGYGVGCTMLKIGPDNAVTQVYANTDMVNHHGGVILHEGSLYGFCDGKGWTCMDFMTGAVKWAEKKALRKGAIHYADKQFYLLEEDTGTVALIDASPSGWSEKGRFILTPQTTQRNPKGKVWTHPTVDNGRLYLRDQELLFSYNISGK